MQRKGSKEQKRNLMEKMGCHFEKGKDSSPLTNKTHSTRSLIRSYGATPEEPVSQLDADKRVPGTPLNPFFIQKRTEYATKRGDRKRHFTISTSYITPEIERLLSRCPKEIGLHQEVSSYKLPINRIPPKHNRFF